jgi:hypothetical protein
VGKIQKKTLIQRIGAGAMALLGLGSAPFWWDKVFPPDKTVAIHFARAGASSDCMRLPTGTKIHATVSKFWPDIDFAPSSTGCDVSKQVSGWRSGTFTLTLSGAGSITLDDAATKYNFDFGKDDKPQIALVSEESLAQVQILMLKYANCPDEGSNLDAFAGALKFRLHNLQQAIVDANAPTKEADSAAAQKILAGQYEYLRSADVLRATADEPGSLSSIERRWSEARALQVLSGQCNPAANTLKLRSEVFGGRFFPYRPNSTIEIDSEVRAGELGDVRDLHLASILYALAIEAKLRGKKDDLERPLLAAALKSVNTSSVSTSEPQRVSLCKDILASFKEDFAQDSPVESCQ